MNYSPTIVRRLAETNPVSELYGSNGKKIGWVCALCNQMTSAQALSLGLHLDDCPYKMALEWVGRKS